MSPASNLARRSPLPIGVRCFRLLWQTNLERLRLEFKMPEAVSPKKKGSERRYPELGLRWFELEMAEGR